MITLLSEIKIMKTDIFDIRNRVKIIMEKVNKIEKRNDLNKDCNITYLKKNIKFDNFDIEDLSKKELSIIIDENNNNNNGDKINNVINNNNNNENGDEINNENGDEINNENGDEINNENGDEINNENGDENENENVKIKDKKIKKEKKKKKEKRNKVIYNDIDIDINKHVEKIILSTNDKVSKIKNDSETNDNSSNFDSDKLEKELIKIIN
jgi:hypothetical protein